MRALYIYIYIYVYIYIYIYIYPLRDSIGPSFPHSLLKTRGKSRPQLFMTARYRSIASDRPQSSGRPGLQGPWPETLNPKP